MKKHLYLNTCLMLIYIQQTMGDDTLHRRHKLQHRLHHQDDDHPARRHRHHESSSRSDLPWKVLLHPQRADVAHNRHDSVLSSSSSHPAHRRYHQHQASRQSIEQSSTTWFGNRRIEQALDAFHTLASTTHPPPNRHHHQHHHKHHPRPSTSRGDRPGNREDITTMTGGNKNSASSTRSGKSFVSRNHVDDDDYYYYDGEETNDDDEQHPLDDYLLASTDDDNFVVKRSMKSQRLSDDYNYDYADDEPISNSSKPPSSKENLVKPGSVTEEKWKNYGTPEAVEKSRRRYMLEQSQRQQAQSHIERIQREGLCKTPRPKIIKISETSKRYIPHCTILYRCGDDTGCCDSDTKTCVARKTTTVDLHFYVFPLGAQQADIEVLSFINHTECHCMDRYRLSAARNLRVDDAPAVTDRSFVPAQNESSTNTTTRTCQCPRHFNAIQVDDDDEADSSGLRAHCRCDCVNDNQPCQMLKQGREGFAVEDRRCISTGLCTIPACQYGAYSTSNGRCPRTQHQKRTVSRFTYG